MRMRDRILSSDDLWICLGCEETLEDVESGNVYCGGMVGGAWKKPCVEEEAVSGLPAMMSFDEEHHILLDSREAARSLIC